MNSKNHHTIKSGFTLVELLIVISIIAALSSLVLLNYSDITEKSKIRTDIYSAKTITSAIKIYEMNTGKKFLETNEIVPFLIGEGYLEVDSNLTPSIDPESGSWFFDSNSKRILIKATIEPELFSKLEPEDKKYFVTQTE